ncbi:RAxF-45 family protein [Jeotgalibacillus sp. S-D1]|uniref:RAxF-45 family protein n=1 Tax=Jeotgalibacillus sp. S-D1 TaxID=2552189 RepID=UPI00267E0A59|nr:RAxF-45 family protein [Jeotgalibacillus sp. S-D1]
MSNELMLFTAFLTFITICCGIFHAFTLKGISMPFFSQCTNSTSFRDLLSPQERSK